MQDERFQRECSLKNMREFGFYQKRGGGGREDCKEGGKQKEEMKAKNNEKERMGKNTRVFPMFCKMEIRHFYKSYRFEFKFCIFLIMPF